MTGLKEPRAATADPRRAGVLNAEYAHRTTARPPVTWPLTAGAPSRATHILMRSHQLTGRGPPLGVVRVLRGRTPPVP